MISLILPYWQRQAAADRALFTMAETYAGFPFEVMVVDDGSPLPFVPPLVDLNMRLVRMPWKLAPLSPVTAWNVGAVAATGPLLAFSCIEVLHTKPVLGQMAAELEKIGPSGVVLAAAWCPELNEWHCHSTHKSAGAPDVPKGTGRPFCALMHRSLHEAIGGFDEDYRDGAGFEDMDWINRLLKVGARFVIRDDLVVVHPKTGARTQWGAGMFERNLSIYQQKWGHA